MSAEQPQSLFVEHTGLAAPVRIAVRAQRGAPGLTGLFWLGGFKAEMSGTKATMLAEWAVTQGRAFTRFDYSGNGESGGAFTDGTIGRWLAEAQAVFDSFTRGPQILVGSSMGAWIALLLARARLGAARAQSRIAGLVLIAPATDFTEGLWQRLPQETRAELMRSGRYFRPSEYEPEPYEITLRLIEEGRDHLLLDGPVFLPVLVRILHGMADPDVPWQHGVRTAEAIDSDDVEITLIKQGDHRLSRPRDLARLTALIEQLCAQVERPAQ